MPEPTGAPPTQPKFAPPHTLCAAAPSPAAKRAPPDICGAEPAADEANPPTHRSTERAHDTHLASAPSPQHGQLDLPGSQPGLDANRIDLYVTTGASSTAARHGAGRP